MEQESKFKGYSNNYSTDFIVQSTGNVNIDLVEFTTIMSSVSQNSSSTHVVNSECELYSDTLFVFLVSGIGTTFICLFGVFGNILSAIVLSRPSMRSSVNIILFALSIYDLIFVIISLLFYGLSGILQYFCIFMSYNNYFLPIVAPRLFPFISIAQLGSIYMTICVTIERFIVVSLPLKARSWCTTKRATWISLLVASFCIIYNIPTWWEYYYIEKYMNDKLIGYSLELTEFRKSYYYVLFYVTWGSFIIYRLIPFGILVVLNTFICIKIHQANKTRKQMSTSQANEISITKVLLCIILIFLLCNLLALILNFREAFGHGQSTNEIIHLSAFFVTINSAVNFLIYCLMGKKFRKVCWQILYENNCCCFTKRKESLDSQGRTSRKTNSMNLTEVSSVSS